VSLLPSEVPARTTIGTTQPNPATTGHHVSTGRPSGSLEEVHTTPQKLWNLKRGPPLSGGVQAEKGGAPGSIRGKGGGGTDRLVSMVENAEALRERPVSELLDRSLRLLNRGERGEGAEGTGC